MHVLILIEPIDAGHFRAKAGEPFGLSAEGKTVEEATQQLQAVLHERLQSGSHLALLEVGNGLPATLAPLHLEPLPDDNWFFQILWEAIA